MQWLQAAFCVIFRLYIFTCTDIHTCANMQEMYNRTITCKVITGRISRHLKVSAQTRLCSRGIVRLLDTGFCSFLRQLMCLSKKMIRFAAFSSLQSRECVHNEIQTKCESILLINIDCHKNYQLHPLTGSEFPAGLKNMGGFGVLNTRIRERCLEMRSVEHTAELADKSNSPAPVF